MSLFSVNNDICNKDGLCVAACPMGIIEFKQEGSFPTPTEDAAEICINCGHCVAVCTTAAMSLETMKPEQCAAIQKDLLPSPEAVEQLLRSRRSIRSYKDKPVAKDTLTELIDIARYAPSGHNTQPVKWRVVYRSDEVRRLAGLVVDWMRDLIKKQHPLAASMHLDRTVGLWDAGVERICRSAPHLIVTHAPADERTAPIAAATALTYIELTAYAFGLGACWAGYFARASNDWPPMKEALKLPDGHVNLGTMMIGYPAFGYQRIPLRKEAEIEWR